MRLRRLTVCLVALAALSGSAAWADSPGTPNQERAAVIGPHKLRISWSNTAYSRDFTTGPNVIFEVEGQPVDPQKCASAPKPMGIDIDGYCKADPSSGYLNLASYDPDGRLHWDVGGLTVGRPHCFRVWARNRDDDVRSQLPSAWACASLPGERTANTAPALKPSQIAPMRGQTLWLRINSDDVMAQKNDGFVMAQTPGHNCPGPWQDATYQNGGFPGLGGAHERAAADAYWLCWSPLLPGAARVNASVAMPR